MDESDPLEARTARLHALRTTDPVAWAICQKRRGLLTISTFLSMPEDRVQLELDRLVKTKEVKRVKFKGNYSYRPISTEMKRLSRRAHSLGTEG